MPLSTHSPFLRDCRIVSFVFLGMIGLYSSQPARGADNAPAMVVSADATVVARSALDKPWRILHTGSDAPAGDMLVGFPGAELLSADKLVTLTLLSDLEKKSPFPIVESAVILHPAMDGSLDFTLDRGRVEVAALRRDRGTKVRVHFRDRIWDMTLKPGAKFQMEIFGRWKPGAKFDPDAKAGEGPVSTLLLLVTEGEVLRRCDQLQLALKAPPGAAACSWDSIDGEEGRARHVEKLPEWVVAPQETPDVAKRREYQARARKEILAKGIEVALKEFLTSDDALARQMGMNGLGALDRLDLLAEVLTKTEHMDTWNYGVIALRHWLGRGPGQDKLLYDGLIKRRDFSPEHARIVVQLLFGFTEEQIHRPELYQVLITLLRHDKLAIRGLAYWHLRKLAPGVPVKFNPADPEKEWERAVAEYRKAIRPGKMPPAPKLDEEKP